MESEEFDARTVAGRPYVSMAASNMTAGIVAELESANIIEKDMTAGNVEVPRYVRMIDSASNVATVGAAPFAHMVILSISALIVPALLVRSPTAH